MCYNVWFIWNEVQSKIEHSAFTSTNLFCYYGNESIIAKVYFFGKKWMQVEHILIRILVKEYGTILSPPLLSQVNGKPFSCQLCKPKWCIPIQCSKTSSWSRNYWSWTSWQATKYRLELDLWYSWVRCSLVLRDFLIVVCIIHDARTVFACFPTILIWSFKSF